jgi:hypothetical protein
MVIVNDKPGPCSFSIKNAKGRIEVIEFNPGKNEVSDESWQKIKEAYSSKWDIHYGQFLREWKPLNTDIDLSDELTAGPLSQFARPDGFECLSLHDALETAENTADRQILEGYLHDETTLGRGRKQVLEAISAKIRLSPSHQKEQLQKSFEQKAINDKWLRDHPGRA